MLKSTDNEVIIGQIRIQHRQRRFSMKVQQKLDRALESYVRINCTEWNPDLDETERAKYTKIVQDIISKARKQDGPADVIELTEMTDKARAPADKKRKETEESMAALARQLPAWQWVETIKGAGALGLATIVAETGDLANYANPGKLWKRLMLAPYDGHAGSTWKREKWRPRTLTKEEWIENPFSGQRYGLMRQIVTWLVNSQIESKAKSGTKHGKAKGPYGEAYIKRREHTDTTHPDWTPGHAQSDALRYTMKRFLKHLWQAWRNQMPNDDHEE